MDKEYLGKILGHDLIQKLGIKLNFTKQLNENDIEIY